MRGIIGSRIFEREDEFVEFAAFVRRLGEPIDEDLGTSLVVFIASAMRDLDGRHGSSLATSYEHACGKMVSISRRLCRWSSSERRFRVVRCCYFSRSRVGVSVAARKPERNGGDGNFRIEEAGWGGTCRKLQVKANKYACESRDLPSHVALVLSHLT